MALAPRTGDKTIDAEAFIDNSIKEFKKINDFVKSYGKILIRLDKVRKYINQRNIKKCNKPHKNLIVYRKIYL